MFWLIYVTMNVKSVLLWLESVAYLGGPLCETPLGRTAVIFVSILGLFLVPFIQNCCHQ